MPRGRLFQQADNAEKAIYHWLSAQEYETAAEMMVRVSETLVRDGRFDTMSEWITTLSPPVLEQFPDLMYRMGKLCRFAGRFDEALAWYEQAKERYDLQRDVAGASRALRGQAAVYLDTVRPIKAESLLQEALRLIDGQQYREEQVVFGFVFIVLVMFLPYGVVGTWRLRSLQIKQGWRRLIKMLTGQGGEATG